MQHCSPSTFQVSFPGLQPSSIEIWVLQPPALQNQLSQVSFLGIFRATTPPYNFLMATVLLFVKSLFEVKRKRTRAFWEFNVCSLWFEHAQLFHISHFTYHLRYYMIMDYFRAVNNALTSYIRLCNLYYIKPNRTNQSCSPSKISQSINVEWRTCDRNSKLFF